MSKRPGVMVYFDLRRALSTLPYTDKGILFDAILEYGETGQVTKLSKRTELLWPLLQMRLDNDGTRYQKVVVKRKYAAYVRWANNHNEPVMSYEDWKIKKGYDLLQEPEDDPTFFPAEITGNSDYSN